MNRDFADMSSELSEAGVEYLVDGRSALIRSKHAAGCKKDLIDAAWLEEDQGSGGSAP